MNLSATKYEHTNSEDITACKELARTIIKRNNRKGIENDSGCIEYNVCSFFGCMNVDFRFDFEEWIKEEIIKSK